MQHLMSSLAARQRRRHVEHAGPAALQKVAGLRVRPDRQLRQQSGVECAGPLPCPAAVHRHDGAGAPGLWWGVRKDSNRLGGIRGQKDAATAQCSGITAPVARPQGVAQASAGRASCHAGCTGSCAHTHPTPALPTCGSSPPMYSANQAPKGRGLAGCSCGPLCSRCLAVLLPAWLSSVVPCHLQPLAAGGRAVLTYAGIACTWGLNGRRALGKQPCTSISPACYFHTITPPTSVACAALLTAPL